MMISPKLVQSMRQGLLVASLLMVSVPSVVFANTTSQTQTWTVNLQDADIKAFIQEVASITKQNFIIDPRINGTVTVVSHRPLSKDELYQLFLSVMQVNNIAAVDTGLTVKLVPDASARQIGAKVDLENKLTGETPTTRVVYLSRSNASDILTAIRPLMPATAHAAAVASSNALVLSDTANNLTQLEALIKQLDDPNNETMQVVGLRHVDAQRMMDLITALTATTGSAPVPTSTQTPTNAENAAIASSAHHALKIVADSAADRLIIRGNPTAVAQLVKMVNELDTLPAKRLSGMRVFRLKYASATHLASMLDGLLTNQSLTVQAPTPRVETASLDAATTTNTATSAATNTTRSTNTNNSTARPFSIIADETQNALVVNASPELMPEIEMAINELDTRRAQVLIQAAIVEISGDDAKQLGVQWALGNANSGYGVVNFNNVGVSATTLAGAVLAGTSGASGAATAIAGALLGLGDSRVDSSGNRQFYGAILQALSTTTSANLLSMPSILTLDNEKASILVGQNVPFVTGSYTTTADSSTNPFQTIERKDVGIHLNVVPHIGENGTVRLEVSQEVSSVVPSSVGNATGIVTNKSLINTTILADNGQTIALGGLMRDNSIKSQQKVPVLGNVPVIGRLFRSDDTSNEKSNLIIFLQPTILRDGGAVAGVTEYQHNQMRTMQLVIDANGTIKKVPLSGLGDATPVEYQMAPLNPFAPTGVVISP
ncbi:MAG: type II secretion system secretin GspD [Moraxella sp.]|nr:type II secretion system secretin GspD [Moraxella sp.]